MYVEMCRAKSMSMSVASMSSMPESDGVAWSSWSSEITSSTSTGGADEADKVGGIGDTRACVKRDCPCS